jgi:serine/threonine protein kinase/hemoglobin-like flavoprotein
MASDVETNLPLPSRLGEFELVRKIGEGGMGVVYEAVQRTTGHRRAIKLMLAPLAADARWRERFDQEARIGSRIASDHVTQVVATGFDERRGLPWLAMELLEGRDLEQHLRSEGRMPIRDVALVMAQVVHALAAAHDVGIVHRDIKPDNVFLATSRVVGVPFMVKILDFGIAKLGTSVRAATVAVGTPGYMAPEQTAASDEIGPAADIWPLGLMVFRMLTGASFWRSSSSMPLLWREMLVDPIPKASARAAELGLAEHLPAEFDAWFAACVEREPSLRFAHARAAGHALASVLGVALPGQVEVPAVVRAHASDRTTSTLDTIESGLVESLDVGTIVQTRVGQPSAASLASPVGPSHRVVFREEGERVVALALEGGSLLDASLAAGIPHFHACGGRARCSTCRVVVLEGGDSLSPRTPAEQAIARRSAWPATTRLACQAKVQGPCMVRRLVVDGGTASLVDIRRTAEVDDTRAQAGVVLFVRLEGIDDVLADGFPDDAIHVLERCLAPLQQLAGDNGGRLATLEGTRMVVVFEDSQEGVRRALRVALRCVPRVRRLNPTLLKHFGVQVGIAAGLARGAVVEGVAGFGSQRERVVLGAALRDARLACGKARAGEVLASPGLLEGLELVCSAGPEGLSLVHDFGKSDVVFLVQSSFDRLEGKALPFASAFYERLFEIHPAAEPLFEHSDMARQRQMLMDTIALAVRGLDDVGAIAGALRELGQRHVGYGATLRDYKFVGQALIETLAEFLGDAFTPEAELAWREIYSVLVRAMNE